jgi:hypothetical protein
LHAVSHVHVARVITPRVTAARSAASEGREHLCDVGLGKEGFHALIVLELERDDKLLDCAQLLCRVCVSACPYGAHVHTHHSMCTLPSARIMDGMREHVLCCFVLC